MDPDNFVGRGGGRGVINTFHRGPYEPPSRSNRTKGVPLLLEGVRTSFSKETYNPWWESGPLSLQLDPPMERSIPALRRSIPALRISLPGRVAQSVTCLATDACLTAIPGVASSIPTRSHTFVEIDHEIISTVILLPSADSFKKGCCQLQAKYVHESLVIRLFKPAQEKVWLGELTVPQ